MKNCKLFLLLFIIGFSSIAVAQNSPMTGMSNMSNMGGGSSGPEVTPMDAPPHHGIVKPSGKYYIEVVVDWMLSENNAVFYLIKDNGKAITNDKITCTAVIQRADQEDEEVVVRNWGTEAFSAQLKSDESYHLKITFQKKKRKFSAIFQTNDKH